MALKIHPPALLEVIPYATRQKAMLKTRYGLSPDAFKALWAQQNGQCPICCVVMRIHKTKSLRKDDCCVDHIEGTKLVRGLLCRTCNMFIGLAKHDTKKLEAALQYLHNSVLKPS